MSTGIKKFQYAETLSRVHRNFNLCLSDLLIYDIFFKIVATVIWGPAAAWLFNRLVATSGSLVIGNEQIITFILSPVGLGAFILSGGLALAIVFAEQAGLILIASRSEAGQRMIFFHAYWWMLKSLGKLMELGVRQVIAGALYLAPLAAIGAAAFFLLISQHDVNYLLTAKPPAFWIGASVAVFLGIGGLLIIGCLYIRWIFSVPLCMLEGDKPAAAMRKSRTLVAGNFRQIAVIIWGWGLLILAVAGAITFLLDGFSALILNSIGENPVIVITAVCVLLAFYGLTAAVLTFIGFAVNCLLVTRLYFDISNRNGSWRINNSAGVTADQSIQAQAPRRKLVWAAALTALVMTAISSYLIVENIDFDHQAAVTAHRGSSKHAPENTLSAVRRAIEDGADFAEIDVQETADGVAVLLHDTDLMRITGVDKKIC